MVTASGERWSRRVRRCSRSALTPRTDGATTVVIRCRRGRTDTARVGDRLHPDGLRCVLPSRSADHEARGASRRTTDWPALLSSTWRLGRFEQLEEVWNVWEDWFIDLGESHTTFPELAFFRSPHPQNHWVLATEGVLDGAALFTTVCDVPRQSRAELCLHAGIRSLATIADFLGIPRDPVEPNSDIALPEQRFDQACQEFRELGIPVREDLARSWSEFQSVRARYEPVLAAIGRLTDAPRSDWSSWSETAPRHRLPLLRPHRDGPGHDDPLAGG